MIVVEGADQLAALSKKLKEAGAKDLQKELNKGISTAMRPVRAAIKASALSTLPVSGGLAAKIAASSFRTSKRANGIRLIGRNPYVLQRLDAGSVRHPVFGDRAAWVTQQVPPGWWTKPTEASAPVVRAEISKAMDAVAAKI